MRKIIVLLAFVLGGCTLAQFEQDAAAIVAKVKAQAPVVIAEIDSAVNFVCMTGLPAANTALMQVRGTFPNPGPKTAKAIRDGNNAIVGASVACDTYAATPSTGAKLNLLMKLWAGYNAGKAAATAANTAAGT